MEKEKKTPPLDKIAWWTMIGTIALMVFGIFASENFYEIISKPDNIPIAMMLVIVEYVTYISFKQAMQNDEHSRRGERHRIYEEMVR